MSRHELDVDLIPRQKTPESIRQRSDCVIHTMGPSRGCHDWQYSFGWHRTCTACGVTVLVFAGAPAPQWRFMDIPRRPEPTPPPSFWTRFRQWTKP